MDPTAPVSVSAGSLPKENRLGAIGAALGAGVAAATLGTWHDVGLGTALAAAAIGAAWLGMAKARARTVTPAEKAAVAALVVLGALPLLRASPWLRAYDAVLFVGIALLLPVFARPGAVRLALPETLHAFARAIGAVLAAAPVSISQDVDSSALARQARAPLIGLAVAAPLALAFLALFVQADPVFSSMLQRMVGDGWGASLGRVTVAGLTAWSLLGLLALVGHKSAPEGEVGARATAPLGVVELCWGLGLICGMFVLFVGAQVAQIAGFASALALPGVTYSGAAREGFFQLLAVVALVIGVVLGAAWLVERGRASGDAAHGGHARLLLRFLLVLTALVATSALVRMARYTDAYGFTELRFHASALMAWLLVVLAVAERTAVRRAPGRFVPAALASAVVAVVVLHGVNPDAVIARTNLPRGDKLDVWHLATLSHDAAPTLAAHVDGLSPAQREGMCRFLNQQADAIERTAAHGSIWSASLSRTNAADARCAPLTP